MKQKYIWTYKFTNLEIIDLIKASSVAYMVGHIPEFSKDDINDIIKRLSDHWITGKWFIRMDDASPKDYMKWVDSPTKTIKTLCKSERIAKNCFPHNNTTIYFFNFDDSWNEFHEYRCFVYNGKCVGISQYVWHQQSPWTLSDQQLTNIATKIICFVNMITSKLVKYKNTFVIDVYYNVFEDMDPSCIEINNYYTSGSCLFNWFTDKHILLNNLNTTEIRIVN